MSNAQTVQRMYDAFARGDVAEILENLAEDVVWEYGVNSTDLPWLQPRRGRAAVAKFFESLGEIDFHKFQPKTILEGDRLAVSLIDFAGVVKATGKPIVEDDEVHIFYFDDRGQVIKFRHQIDTHQHWLASNALPVATASAP